MLAGAEGVLVEGRENMLAGVKRFLVGGKGCVAENSLGIVGILVGKRGCMAGVEGVLAQNGGCAVWVEGVLAGEGTK